jgi:hypothetical protein
LEEPRFLDKLVLGFGTGSKAIAKAYVGDHLQVFSLVRGGKRLIGLRHSHGGDVRYYAYPENEARALADKIIQLLPPATPNAEP